MGKPETDHVTYFRNDHWISLVPLRERHARKTI